jgi:dihydrofolate reductase
MSESTSNNSTTPNAAPTPAPEATRMRISLVVAAARNGVIGHQGEIPWRLPDDQRFFRRLTTGHAIVMGRKTFDSIGKPLPSRTNLVLSRSDLSKVEGIHGFASLHDAETWARNQGETELFVIGGEALYRDAMERADLIYLTRVEAEPEGDAFFPEIDQHEWKCIERDARSADDRHGCDFIFETWARRG